MDRSADLLIRLKNSGATVSLNGDQLVLKGPKNSLGPALRQEILEQKNELIAVLKAATRQEFTTVTSRRGDSAPLSNAQRRIWFLSRLDPESTVWNIGSLVEIRGSLHQAALEFALDEVVSRHRVLRSCFKVFDGIPRMQFREAVHGALEVLHAAPPAEARARAREIAATPFDLEAGGLFRAVLFVLDDTHHFLLLSAHHIVLDGWSLGVVSREVATLYASFAQGAVSTLPEPIDFEEYVAWEQNQEERSSKADLAWWLHKLSGPLPLLELPSDRSRVAHPSNKGERISMHIPIAMTERLNALAATHEVTAFVLLLTAFKVLLYRYTNLTDIIVGTASSYRKRTEFENVVGMFANPVVLRTDLSRTPRFDELLLRVRDTVRDAFAHDSVPFDRLVEHLHPDRDRSQTPLFQVAFAYQNLPLTPIALSGVNVSPQDLEFCASRYDLSVEIWKTPSGLLCDFEFSTALFDRSTIQRLQRHYLRLLEGILKDSSTPVHQLEMLSDEERYELAVDWNGKRSNYPAEPIHTLVERRCRELPDEAALIDGGRVISGRELNALANAVAIRLQTMGAAPGIPIAVVLARSCASVIAMLAILKTGGICVPLDPNDPDERLSYLVKDVGARLAITSTACHKRMENLAGGISLLDIYAHLSSPAQAKMDSSPAMSPDDLMCILYTSGSTGQPKGVEIRHRSVARLLFSDEFRSFGAHESTLHMGAENFDISLLEIWGPLVHGGRCIIYPDRQPNGSALQALCKKHAITTAWFTTSVFNWIVTDAPGALQPLRRAYVGGEALSVPHIRKAQNLFPELEIINGYGPTEGTTFTSIYVIPPNLSNDLPSIPIGRPISNTFVYILDAHQQLVPIGVTGELYIGGDGLARGYRGRPELTREQFVEDLIPGSGVLYRSGDLATWLADGTIRFLGRADQQVKVRGHRIEIGEIEAAIAAIPGIAASVVTVHSSRYRGDLIVAWFTSEEFVSINELRSTLKLKLPGYMVPNLFERLETMPMLSSGKIDRSALASRSLPDPKQEGMEEKEVCEDAPLLIAQVMAELLEMQKVGIDEDFFNLGGHSLLATQLAARLEKLFGRGIPVALLFQASTPRAIAQQLEHEAGEPAKHVVALQPHGVKPPLFFTHLSDGKIQCYLSLVRALGQDQPAYGIYLADLKVPGVNGSASIPEIAEIHLQELRSIRPSGPYAFCGFSSGGALAYEMARQLSNQGEVVRLILLDSFAPPPLRERLRFLRIKTVRRDLIPVAIRFTSRHVRRLAKALSRRIKSETSEVPLDASDNGHRLEALLDRAQKRYKPQPFQGDLLLIHAEDDKLNRYLNVEELHYWDRCVLGKINVIRLPGDHNEMMKPPMVARTASLLLQALADWGQET